MTTLAMVGAVAVIALVWSERVGNAVRLVAKPLASVCFIGVALVAGAADTAYGRWVLAALVLSAIGDVALLGRSSANFLVGLGSFLLGHVAYCVAFVARGADLRAILISALVRRRDPSTKGIAMTNSNRTRGTVGAVVAAGALAGIVLGPASAQAEPQGYDQGDAGVALVYGTFNPPGETNQTLLVGGDLEGFCEAGPAGPGPGEAPARFYLRNDGTLDVKINDKDQPIYLYEQNGG